MDENICGSGGGGYEGLSYEKWFCVYVNDLILEV